MYSEKGLNKNAIALFNSTQWQRLNNFFEEHGETVYNIFKNTITTSGVMVLFIVINGLTKNFKDFLLNPEHEPRNIILLPRSFDKVLLKQYQKLRTKREYVLKCKICDFISYITYTMEHMAFVHNIHHGFGLTMNISNSLKNIPTIKRCIFETPNSDNCHLFRDHFIKITNLRYKKLDVHFNNRNNLLSKCFLAYIRYLEKNGKLYTIERCEHENQMSSLRSLKCCGCIKNTMVFYKRFHTKLFELLKKVGLTHMRKDRFESRDSLKLPQHTKKINIFKKFETRIVKVYPDFFTTDNEKKYATKAEINEQSDNSIEIITENCNIVIKIDSSNSSHAETSQVPPNIATQTLGFGIPFSEETQNCFDDIKGSTDTLIVPYNLCEVVVSSENNESYDTKANIIKIDEVQSEPKTLTSTLYNIEADKIGKTKSISQSKREIRSSLSTKIKKLKKSKSKAISTKKPEETLHSNRNLKSPTIKPSISEFETLIKEILTTETNTSDKNDEIHKPVTPAKDTNNPDEAPDQDSIESYLNKHFNLNESKSNFLEFPVDYIESVVDDSSKISNKVRIFEKYLFGDSLKCDPIEEYEEYQKYNRFLSMLKSKHTKSIEQNESYEESTLSFLKSLDFEDKIMNVVQLQTKNDYEDILNQYSTAYKLNCLFLDELKNPNVGSAIFRDILSESIDSVAIKTESCDMQPFIIDVPANFKANCNIASNKSILSSINKIIEKKTQIDTMELKKLLNLLKTFVDTNKDGE